MRMRMSTFYVKAGSFTFPPSEKENVRQNKFFSLMLIITVLEKLIVFCLSWRIHINELARVYQPIIVTYFLLKFLFVTVFFSHVFFSTQPLRKVLQTEI